MRTVVAVVSVSHSKIIYCKFPTIYALQLTQFLLPFLTGMGLHHVSYKILSYLDAPSLCRAEQVCWEWYRVIAEGMLWKKLIAQKVQTDPVWKGLSERRGW